MSYVLNKVLNMDVVNIINKQVVTDTINTLKEKVKAYQGLYDLMVGKCNNMEKLLKVEEEKNKLLIAKYEISIDNVGKYFYTVKIIYWAMDEGDTGNGDGLIYNLNESYKKDFEEWYSDAKMNCLNWFVSNYYEDKKQIPNDWVYDAMKYEIEHSGNLEIYEKKLKGGYEEFMNYVVIIKLTIYLDENEQFNFKEHMKCFYTAAIEEDEGAEYDD